MAVTYTLRYRTSDVGAGAGEWTAVTGLSGTSHAVDGLASGVRYDVEVVAVSDGGVESTPATDGRWTVCAAPAQPTTSAVLAETLDVGWTAVTGAASYRVERTPTGGGDVTVVGTVTAPTTTLAVTGLAEESGYDLTVRAVNADGDVSDASPTRSATTTALAAGGTVDTDGVAGYRIHTFTTATADPTFTLNAVRDVEYLVVAGGASGTRGTCSVLWGHGGGGGGVSTGTLAAATTGEYTVDVGVGGPGSTTVTCSDDHEAADGGDSALGRAGTPLVVATGGRGVPGRGPGATSTGGASGTGAIDGVAYTARAGGTGTGQYGAGGGGGAGSAAVGLAGGTGVTSSITGAPVVYGGGGAGRSSAGFGTPGDGAAVGETAAAADRGGGGSDRVSGDDGYQGGADGVVVLRYRVAPASP